MKYTYNVYKKKKTNQKTNQKKTNNKLWPKKKQNKMRAAFLLLFKFLCVFFLLLLLCRLSYLFGLRCADFDCRDSFLLKAFVIYSTSEKERKKKKPTTFRSNKYGTKDARMTKKNREKLLALQNSAERTLVTGTPIECAGTLILLQAKV